MVLQPQASWVAGITGLYHRPCRGFQIPCFLLVSAAACSFTMLTLVGKEQTRNAGLHFSLVPGCQLQKIKEISVWSRQLFCVHRKIVLGRKGWSFSVCPSGRVTWHSLSHPTSGRWQGRVCVEASLTFHLSWACPDSSQVVLHALSVGSGLGFVFLSWLLS